MKEWLDKCNDDFEWIEFPFTTCPLLGQLMFGCCAVFAKRYKHHCDVRLYTSFTQRPLAALTVVPVSFSYKLHTDKERLDNLLYEQLIANCQVTCLSLGESLVHLTKPTLHRQPYSRVSRRVAGLDFRTG